MVASRGLYSSMAKERKPACLKQPASLRNQKGFAQSGENVNTYNDRAHQWCLNTA